MRDNSRLRPPADGVTVKDPTLRVGRRRIFIQPATGRGRRAFTAAGAMRKVHRAQQVKLSIVLADRWCDARERETELRGRTAGWLYPWPHGAWSSRLVRYT